MCRKRQAAWRLKWRGRRYFRSAWRWPWRLKRLHEPVHLADGQALHRRLLRLGAPGVRHEHQQVGPILLAVLGWKRLNMDTVEGLVEVFKVASVDGSG